MERLIGKVVEVFIPEEYIGDRKIDVMDSKKIGFKVMLENGLIEIIQEDNDKNCDIYREDLVVITRENISGKEFFDIELW